MPETSTTRRAGTTRARNTRTIRETGLSKLAEESSLLINASNEARGLYESYNTNEEESHHQDSANGIVVNNGVGLNEDSISASQQQQQQQQQYDDQYYSSAPMYYPGINDMADALEALPMEIIRHFTLLREIDAKCVSTTPELTGLIKEFLDMPVPSRELEAAAERAGGPNRISLDVQTKIAELAIKRERILYRIRLLIRDLMPCLEEKMHVAGVAADAINRHIARLDYDFDELIVKGNEIPHEIRYGPEIHPAYLPIVTATEQKQSTRSEARREAMAARKAAQATATSIVPPTASHVAHSIVNGAGSGRNTPHVEEKLARGIKPSASTGRGTSNIKGRKGSSSAAGGNNNSNGRNTNNSHATNHGAELTSTKGGAGGSNTAGNGKGVPRSSNRDDDSSANVAGRKRSNAGIESVASYGNSASTKGGNSSVSGGNSSNKRRRANPANGEDYRGDGDGNDGFRSQYEKRGTNSSKLANKDDDGSIREADGDGEQDTKLSRKSASSGSNGGKKKASSGTSSGANNGGSGVTNGNSIKKKKSGSTLTSGSGSSRQSKNLKKSSKSHADEDDLVDEEDDGEMDEEDENDEDEDGRFKRGASDGSKGSKNSGGARTDSVNSSNGGEAEQVYCYCQQVSYGEMVACDGPKCDKEWFHLPCIGMSSPPRGQWFCRDCKKELARQKRNQGNTHANQQSDNTPEPKSESSHQSHKSQDGLVNSSGTAEGVAVGN